MTSLSILSIELKITPEFYFAFLPHFTLIFDLCPSRYGNGNRTNNCDVTKYLYLEHLGNRSVLQVV